MSFSADPIPKPNPDVMMQANQSGQEWNVALSVQPDVFSGCAGPAGGTVCLTPFDDSKRVAVPFTLPNGFPAVTNFIKVDDGYIVAADEGEYGGGGIFFFGEAGQGCVEITRQNCCGLTWLGGRPYAIVGMNAESGAMFGSILRLDREAHNRWNLALVADLQEGPYCFANESSESVLILTTYTLQRYTATPTGEGRLERLQTHDFRFLFPNSMVLSAAENGSLYVGMRAFVVRLARDYTESNGFREEWFVPRQAAPGGPQPFGRA
ncbi:hypothetical protein PAPYR_8090 [Paratrimastix pyriformis]|uniref:Strictosidine synthase n=1 Tax=Paratrimastix pyriformis TaxID=342808 RepID=A0ABQ8UBE0_9EUKA|nr:hypothetical protein PAPYR_8090 [Paratrimastix pyriformis]